MQLASADYVILALGFGGGVIGLFIGFSGALAFLSGSFAAAAAGTFGYRLLDGVVMHAGVKGLVSGVGALFVFGVVRFLVKRLVHGLLAQPGDALFGLLVAAATWFALGLVSVWGLGVLTENPAFASTFVDQVRVFVGWPIA